MGLPLSSSGPGSTHTPHVTRAQWAYRPCLPDEEHEAREVSEPLRGNRTQGAPLPDFPEAGGFVFSPGWSGGSRFYGKHLLVGFHFVSSRTYYQQPVLRRAYCKNDKGPRLKTRVKVVPMHTAALGSIF